MMSPALSNVLNSNLFHESPCHLGDGLSQGSPEKQTIGWRCMYCKESAPVRVVLTVPGSPGGELEKGWDHPGLTSQTHPGTQEDPFMD
jgi:hypothetical protein